MNENGPTPDCLRYLDALKNDDSLVLQEMCDMLFPEIRSFLFNLGAKNDQPKEIFQEALLITFRKAQADELLLNKPLVAYLKGVSRLVWLKQIEKGQRQPVTNARGEEFIQDGMDVPSIESELHQQFLLNMVEKYLNKIDEQCRLLIKFIYIDLKSYKEVVAQLESFQNENAARQKVHRCKDKLLRLIQNDLDYREYLK